jgi:hypothetical protein
LIENNYLSNLKYIQLYGGGYCTVKGNTIDTFGTDASYFFDGSLSACNFKFVDNHGIGVVSGASRMLFRVASGQPTSTLFKGNTTKDSGLVTLAAGLTIDSIEGTFVDGQYVVTGNNTQTVKNLWNNGYKTSLSFQTTITSSINNNAIG